MGNAPEDDISVQLEIARLMEQAQDPSDALHLYKTILRRHPSLREALEGAGRTAFKLGRYLEAKHYLGRALEGPGIDQEPAAVVQQSRDDLNEATRLLLLYPSARLNPRERSARILTGRKLALARLAECTQDKTAAPVKAAASAPASNSLSNPLAKPGVSFCPPSTRAHSEPGDRRSPGRPVASSAGTMAAVACQNLGNRTGKRSGAGPDADSTHL